MNIDKDIGDNPTPQQVKDYYDLHTGEGAANFSNEDAGITVQLWHSLAQALKENERLRKGHEDIIIWGKAYPVSVFTEPDLKKAHELLKAGGMTLDAVSASAMRHVLKGVVKIAEDALKEGG